MGALGAGAWWWMVLLVVGLGSLVPVSSAHARGHRTVPSVRDSRVVPERTTASALTTIGLTIHISSDRGVPIATRRRIAVWVARTNRALAAHNLAVEIRSITHASGFTEVTGRRQRRALASMTEHDGTVHVFVAEHLNPPKPRTRRRIRGLHWRYHGLNRELRQREYVLIARGAPSTTLAHEIGHLLGLRHSTSDNNIMCSCRRGTDNRFTLEQGQSMRQGAWRFAARQHQAKLRSMAQRDRSIRRAYRH